MPSSKQLESQQRREGRPLCAEIRGHLYEMYSSALSYHSLSKSMQLASAFGVWVILDGFVCLFVMPKGEKGRMQWSAEATSRGQHWEWDGMLPTREVNLSLPGSSGLEALDSVKMMPQSHRRAQELRHSLPDLRESFGEDPWLLQLRSRIRGQCSDSVPLGAAWWGAAE